MRREFQVAEFHAEADVGLVVSVLPHGFFPGHAFNGFGIIDPFDVVENPFYQSFKHVQDIFLLHEAHLAIDLCEFRLAVGPQVFIAETLYDLVVAIVPAYHQQLLECLRRLRQGVELSRVHSRRNHKITGAFRGGFDEKGRFDIHEVILMQVVSCTSAYGIA